MLENLPLSNGPNKFTKRRFNDETKFIDKYHTSSISQKLIPMWPLIISLSIIAFILLLLIAILFYIYCLVFYSPHKNQNNDYRLTSRTEEYCDTDVVNGMIKRTLDIPYQDTYIKSFDGKRLHAREYENKESNTICIMAHGYRGTACRDFSGGAYDMINKGFNVILIDQRAHSLSSGHTITFGAKERKDLISWIEYAKKKYGNDKRIVLSGISMGGATVLFTSDYLSEKDKIIADCPYSEIKEILKESLRRLKLNPKIIYPLVYLSAIIFAHFNPNKYDANDYVKNSKANILIIHGDGDTLVPYTHSERVYLAKKDKVTYEIFKGSEHGLSYMDDQTRYQRIVDEFLDKE